MSHPHYQVRTCTVGDAPIIARHRVEMFREMGSVPSGELARALLDHSVTAIAAELRNGCYFGWFAVDHNDRVIGGAGAHVKPQLPRIAGDGKRVALSPVPLVVNVYTEPDWRKKGVARTLMNTIMGWARERNFDRVVLHASAAGRPLYESLGFHATNEMRWFPGASD